MLLCCDVIGVVRRASKDLKTAKLLSRKRSGTARGGSFGRFSIECHTRQEDGRRDYQFERDSVQKVARVKAVDARVLLEGGELERSTKMKISRTISHQRSPSISSAEKRGSVSKRENSVSSRYKDTLGSSFKNCHRHSNHYHETQDLAEENLAKRLADCAPLRSKSNN